MHAVGRRIKITAGADQIAHAHIRFERVIAWHLDAPVDMHDLHGLGEIGLHAQLVHERRDHVSSAGLEIEHPNRIARHQSDIGGSEPGARSAAARSADNTVMRRLGGSSRRISR
jgi:hypothetical protein